MPSLPILLKSLTQLGPGPLALYALYRLGLRSGHYRRSETLPAPEGAKPWSLQQLLALPGRDGLLSVLGEAGQAELLEEANEISAGTVRLFGAGPAPLRLTFDESLRHWTEYEAGKAPIPYSGYTVHDIKFLWEPARFGWALKLGRAYRLTCAERYAEAFWQCFEEFDRGNPAYLGPHWMNGQEVAIRLMCLLWSAQLFGPAAASGGQRMSRLTSSIAEHAGRIPPTLIYARSQSNNHLVVEAASLYAAGSMLAHPQWRSLGWRWLNHAIQRQIGSYGEYIQHSSNYHRLMLQAVLWADAIRRACREAWPSATLEALIRASHWLFSMIDPVSGRCPNLGANDGALILPLATAPFDDFRPTVQAAARAFLRTSLPTGRWDEFSLWLGLNPGERTADSDAYMAEHLRGRNSWAYLRASRFPSRLAHMDQLHFDLWRGGHNLAQDAGTYLYSGDPPWDNPLVSTRVHNTVTVDGEEQMQRAGRFLLLDWFPAYSKSVLEVDEHILGRMLAYHKGYARLGIRHERVATVYADERWEVKDNLVFIKPGEHSFRLHWLLSDAPWEIDARDSVFEIRLQTPDGPATLRVAPDLRIASSKARLSLVRAGQVLYGNRQALPYEGWVSPTYGAKVPALSLALDVTSFRTFSLTTEFLFR